MRFCNSIVFRGSGGAVERGCEDSPAAGSNLAPTPPRTTAPPKTRDRWPFLNEPDCPVELQALITRRITRYHEYSNLYPQLREAQSLTELSALCGKLLDAYLDNQAIFRELEYYQKNRRVLGRHPLFRHFSQIYKLRSMSVRDLLREQQKTRDNIWRVNSELRKGDKPHLEQKRRAKLQEYELKLQEINNLLGE